MYRVIRRTLNNAKVVFVLQKQEYDGYRMYHLPPNPNTMTYSDISLHDTLSEAINKAAQTQDPLAKSMVDLQEATQAQKLMIDKTTIPAGCPGSLL